MRKQMKGKALTGFTYMVVGPLVELWSHPGMSKPFSRQMADTSPTQTHIFSSGQAPSAF